MVPLFIMDPNSALAPGYIQKPTPSKLQPSFNPYHSAPTPPETPRRCVTLPYDIIYLIVTEHLDDPEEPTDSATLSALKLSSRVFSELCTAIQFRSMSFNLRHMSCTDRLYSLCSLSGVNVDILKAVQALSISDNTTPNIFKHEAIFPLARPSNSEKYHSHFEMLEDEVYEQILSDGPSYFSYIFSRVPNLGSFDLSLIYRPISLGAVSIDILCSLCRAIVFQPELKRLSLQGLEDIPWQMLGRFRKLEELYLLDCTVDMGIDICRILRNKQVRRKTSTWLKKSQTKSKISSIHIRNVPYAKGYVLFLLWLRNKDQPGFVDMTEPSTLEVFYEQEDDVYLHQVTPAYVVEAGQQSIERPYLHTLGLGMRDMLRIDMFSEDELSLSEIFPAASPAWFQRDMLMQPNDIQILTNLKELELSFSYWDSTVRHVWQNDEELEWALALFRNAPNNKLRTLTLNVKVGGYIEQDPRRTLDEFGEDIRWLDAWRTELGREKWDNLQEFSLNVYSPMHATLDDGLVNEALGLTGMYFAPVYYRSKLLTVRVNYVTMTNEGLAGL